MTAKYYPLAIDGTEPFKVDPYFPDEAVDAWLAAPIQGPKRATTKPPDSGKEVKNAIDSK